MSVDGAVVVIESWGWGLNFSARGVVSGKGHSQFALARLTNAVPSTA